MAQWRRTKPIIDYPKNAAEENEVTFSGEVLVKFTADKGGGRTNICFNIVNQDNANSPDRHYQLVIYMGDDRHGNIESALKLIKYRLQAYCI